MRLFTRSLSWHALLAVACVAAGALYVLPYVSHLRIFPADDSYFYLGAIRDAGRIGLVDPHIAARPAYPVVGALLGSVSHTPPAIVTAALPIAMVVALGLAGAAFASRSRFSGPGTAVFAALVAGSGLAARLVLGKSENLMTLVLLCSILAAAAWMRGRARWVTVGALALATGLTEWPLLVAFVGVLAAAVLVCELVTRWRGGVRPVLLPMLGSVTAGLVAALAVVLIGGDATLAIRHLPNAEQYGLRFRHEMDLLWWPLTLALVALGIWAARRYRSRDDQPFRMLLAVWLVLTGLALLMGRLGAHMPTYRAVGFALPIALASAAAAFLPLDRFHLQRRLLGRIAAIGAAGVIAILSLTPTIRMWYVRGWAPVSAGQLQQLREAVRYSLTLPPGQQTVVVMHLNPPHYLTVQNLVAALEPVGSDRVLIFIGRPIDALQGVPFLGYAERSRPLLKAVFPPIGRALRHGAAILTGRDLHPVAFRNRTALGEPTFDAGNVVVVRGPPAPSRLPGAPLPNPFLPAPALGGFAAVALGAFLVVGLGWSMLLLARAPVLVRTAAAPGLGMAACAFASVAGTRFGFPPHGGTAVAELAVLVAASAGAAAVHLVRRRRGSRPEPEGDGAAAPVPAEVGAWVAGRAPAHPPSAGGGGPAS
jgi:hypothetical protein